MYIYIRINIPRSLKNVIVRMSCDDIKKNLYVLYIFFLDDILYN